MHVRIILCACVILTMFVASHADEETPEHKRRLAATVEWVIANCTQDVGLNSVAFAMASMIINGSSVGDMEKARVEAREAIVGRYLTAEAACQDFAAQHEASKPRL